jgi:hypothetical protein
VHRQRLDITRMPIRHRVRAVDVVDFPNVAVVVEKSVSLESCLGDLTQVHLL